MKYQEFDELQDLIDTIITTAKLLDYHVSKINITTHLKKNNTSISLEISIYYNTLILSTTTNHQKSILPNVPHIEKIQHLQKILESL